MEIAIDRKKAIKSRLKSDEGITIKELVEMKKDCDGFGDGSLGKKVEERLGQRVKAVKSPVEEALAPNLAGKQTLKRLHEMLSLVETEIPGDSLAKRLRELIAHRNATHRDPLERELDENQRELTLNQLETLSHKFVYELPVQDALNKRLAETREARERSHRAKLVDRFARYINDASVPLATWSEFNEECLGELASTDPLLAQVKSAQEMKASGKERRVVMMDKLERGDQGQVLSAQASHSDDLPLKKKEKKSKKSSSSSSSSSSGAVSSSSSSSNSRRKADAAEDGDGEDKEKGSKRSHHHHHHQSVLSASSSFTPAGAYAGSPSPFAPICERLSSAVRVGADFVGGIREDLSGESSSHPHHATASSSPSIYYKISVFLVFCLYSTLVVSSAILARQVESLSASDVRNGASPDSIIAALTPSPPPSPSDAGKKAKAGGGVARGRRRRRRHLGRFC